MDKTQDPPKRCFCARCFLPIDPEEKVDIEGQSFHRLCSTCCVCRTIPSSLKMFYGHVFCSDCFKTHVLSRFRGDNPRIHSNSWWMQWGTGAEPQHVHNESKETKREHQETPDQIPDEPPKRCFCARCLQSVDDNNKVNIGGQSFHPQCAKCYFCHAIPTDNVKIYYGQVFCEDCFNKHVLNRNKDNPSEFFKHCFDQWQNNAQFAENMKEFLAGNKETAPFIFMMQGQQPPFCRCGTGPQEWFQEPKKCLVNGSTVRPLCEDERQNRIQQTATRAVSTGDENGYWDFLSEDRTEEPDSDMTSDFYPVDESASVENLNSVSAAEKIEKLTKYLHERGLSEPEKRLKKWKNYDNDDSKLWKGLVPEPLCCGWVDLQTPKLCSKTHLDCPKCLWQYGPLFVNSENFIL